MQRPFIKGLELSEVFYRDAVRPLLARQFPDLVYSAARIGPGSDVLGFDTPQSMDHDWGPRLTLFVSERDYQAQSNQIDEVLRRQLAREVRGYPTNFGRHDDGTTVMATSSGELVQHGVTLLTIRGFFKDILGFDPTNDIRARDWLGVPQHHLLMVTAGRVFHDGLGQLEQIREKFRYYPRDVWLYLLAAQWRRIAQEEAFMGRCGQVDDDLGSRLIAARLIRDLMQLCFLMERQYAPYIKWFGSAFAKLRAADTLMPIFKSALRADSWQEREEHLAAAFEFVARMHNELAITDYLSPKVSQFHSRPCLVIHGDRFVRAIRAAISSEEVKALPENLGSIDQFVDSTDAMNRFTCFKEIFG